MINLIGAIAHTPGSTSSRRSKKLRKGRNPATRKTITLELHKVAVFQLSKLFREKLN